HTATAPVPGATTTILQFNASGATAYTANNDIADPFALLGVQFRGTANTAITLTGGALTLSQSGTAGFINQNGSGAATVNNNLTLTNASSATDIAIGGTGSGTVTLNGVISGVGGLQFINLGGATIVISNPANSYRHRPR